MGYKMTSKACLQKWDRSIDLIKFKLRTKIIKFGN